MVTLHSTTALAFPSIPSAELSSLAQYLLKKKNRALKKGILIPDDFIAEMEAYCVRNAVIEKVHNLTGLHHCCPACVKAHAVKHASSIGLNREASGVITKFFRGDIGHDGYYLDQEKLIKL